MNPRKSPGVQADTPHRPDCRTRVDSLPGKSVADEMRIVLAGDLVQRPRQGMAVDPLMLGTRLGIEVRSKAPDDPS